MKFFFYFFAEYHSRSLYNAPLLNPVSKAMMSNCCLVIQSILLNAGLLPSEDVALLFAVFLLAAALLTV